MFASMLKNWEGSIQRFASILFINHIFWARKNSKFQNTWFFIFKYDETLTKPSCFGSKCSFRSLIGHPGTKIHFHHTLYFLGVSKYVFSPGFRKIIWWDHLSSRAYLQIRQCWIVESQERRSWVLVTSLMILVTKLARPSYWLILVALLVLFLCFVFILVFFLCSITCCKDISTNAWFILRQYRCRFSIHFISKVCTRTTLLFWGRRSLLMIFYGT